MQPGIRRLIAGVIACLFGSAPIASAQTDPAEAVKAIDMAELERIAALAQSGSDSRITATVREYFSETAGPQYRTLPSTLVSIEDEPAFVYVKTRFGDASTRWWPHIAFAMRCRGGGILDITINASARAEDLGAITPEQIGHAIPAAMEFVPYGQNISLTLPVAWAETHAWGKPYFRLAGSVRADDPFFAALRGTSNLQGQLILNGSYVRVTAGVALGSLRQDVAPLLAHCQTGKDNPMDRPLAPMTAAAAPAPAETTPAEIDLDFVPSGYISHYRRIYAGAPDQSEDGRQSRLTRALAFHAGYWESCSPMDGQAVDYVANTVWGGDDPIGVPAEDYPDIFIAMSTYQPLSRAIYDGHVQNDFSFDQVMQIYRDRFEREVLDWRSILIRHGCTGPIQDRFRANLRKELPFLEHRQGSREILADFGGRSYSVALPYPVDIEQSRQIGQAEMASANDGIFTDSYPGRILRAITIGNFAKIDEINAELAAAVTRPIDAASGSSTMGEVITGLMKIESRTSRQSGVLTAYAIGRAYHLGSCGEPMNSYSQETVYWTKYVDGFGQVISTSPETRRSTQAEIPSKFSTIIDAHKSIATSGFSAAEMATIVGRLSCDSPARQQLEDNILAYFNGQKPAHIGPIPPS